jgi:parvulin-like peptidyl-prolyl isomerase
LIRRPFLLVLFVSLVFPLCLQAGQVVNRTVATVNGEPVLLSELEKNWQAFTEQQSQAMPPEKMTPEWEKETRQKLLNQMVDEKLLLQEAKKGKARVNQSDVLNGLAQVKARFLPEAAQKQLQNIIQRQIAARPNGARPAGNEENAQVDLAGAWNELAKENPAAIKETNSKLQQELTKEGLTDKTFQDRLKDQIQVAQFSNQKLRSLSKIPTDEQTKTLYDEILALQDKKTETKDQKTQELESLANYFSKQTGERVRARHILIAVAEDADLKEKTAARNKITDILKKILEGADFAEMAEKHSDDKGSAKEGRGGDLGTFTRGDMVPPFEKTAFQLPVGQVSEIVETPFGYHIIKVEEKRAATRLPYDEVKNDLREYLLRSQAQNVFENYISTLRKTASIKVTME